MDAKEIRTRRRYAGLTQAVLAAQLGVTANTVARWEQGKIKPGPRKAKELRDYFRGGSDPVDLWAQHQAAIYSLSNGMLIAQAGASNPPPLPRPDVSYLEIIKGIVRMQAAGNACGVTTVAIGSLALGAHSLIRGTKDFDVMGPTREDLPCFLAAARKAGFEGGGIPSLPAKRPPLVMERHFTNMTWPTVLIAGKPMGADVMIRDSGFLDHVLDRALLAQTAYGPIRVARLEDVLLLKLLSWRMKDSYDLQWALSLRPDIDRAYISRWAKKLRVEDRWEDLLTDVDKAGLKGWDTDRPRAAPKKRRGRKP